MATGAVTKDAAALEAQRAQEEAALKNNWGQFYAANKVLAEQTIDSMKLSPELTAALKASATAMEAFRAVGQQTGEAPFIQGGRGATGVMTKEQATYRLTQLEKDTVWYDKFTKGDVEAVKEFNDLTKIIAS
jgi:hypothetical protein